MTTACGKARLIIIKSAINSAGNALIWSHQRNYSQLFAERGISKARWAFFLRCYYFYWVTQKLYSFHDSASVLEHKERKTDCTTLTWNSLKKTRKFLALLNYKQELPLCFAHIARVVQTSAFCSSNTLLLSALNSFVVKVCNCQKTSTSFSSMY